MYTNKFVRLINGSRNLYSLNLYIYSWLTVFGIPKRIK